MGSISRTNRCDRFRKKLEDKIVAKAPVQSGDRLDVLNVAVGMDDGCEVSKLYVIVRNSRTGNEEEMTFDHCLFDPEGFDVDNVERLHDYLFQDQDDKKYKADRKKVVELLKDAELIDQKY